MGEPVRIDRSRQTRKKGQLDMVADLHFEYIYYIHSQPCLIFQTPEENKGNIGIVLFTPIAALVATLGRCATKCVTSEKY